MCIISIVFVSVFRMHAGNIKLLQYEKFYSVAPLLAANQLAVIETDIMKYDNMSGDFGEAYQGYEWECKIEELSLNGYNDSDSLIDKKSIEQFKKIILKISGFDKDHIYEITTWRYFENQ